MASYASRYGYVYADSEGGPDDGGAVTLKHVRGGAYEIESLGRVLTATLHAKAPVDPTNLRVQGRYDEL